MAGIQGGEGARAEGDWSVVDATDGTKMGHKGAAHTWVDDKQPGDCVRRRCRRVWHTQSLISFEPDERMRRFRILIQLAISPAQSCAG